MPPATGTMTLGGRLVRLQLPPHDLLDGQPKIQRLAAEHRRLTAQLAEVRAHVRSLEEQRRDAEAKDRAAYAKALRDGKNDPGPTQTREVDRKAAAARRRAEATDEALGDIEAEVVAAVEADRADWLAEIDHQIKDRRTRYSEVVEALAEARKELVTQEALQMWVENVPRRPVWTVAPGWLQRLTSSSGAPHDWPQVLGALRADSAREDGGGSSQ